MIHVGGSQPTAAVWRAGGNGARQQERVRSPTGGGCCPCNLFSCLAVTSILGILLGLSSIALNVVAIKFNTRASLASGSAELRNWDEHYSGIWYGSANVFFFAVALILVDVLSRVWKREADCPDSRTRAVRSLSGILAFIFGAVMPLAGFSAIVLSIVTVVLSLAAGNSLWTDDTLQFSMACLGACLLLFIVNLVMLCVSCCVLCRTRGGMHPLPATHTVLVTPLPSISMAHAPQGNPPSYNDVLRSSSLASTSPNVNSLQANWLGSLSSTAPVAQAMDVMPATAPPADDGLCGGEPLTAAKRFGERQHQGESAVSASAPPQYSYPDFTYQQELGYPTQQ